MSMIQTAQTPKAFPEPPPGKFGWPWTTTKTDQNYDFRENDNYFPRITIVTPSYNQGKFLEATIRSVLLQNYPNLEYIIIDGGSNDESVEIIRKYEPWLTFWKSAKDKGQSDAINQGFLISTGSIMGWLNSDDLLAEEATFHLAASYKPGVYWWIGTALQIDETGAYLPPPRSVSHPVSKIDLLYARKIICQVSTFWTRELWEQTGGYISNLRLAMDYELWLRFAQVTSSTPIPHTIGMFRSHSGAKTVMNQGFKAYLNECDQVRLHEFQNWRYQHFWLRAILTFFLSRYSMAKSQGWRAWIGRRSIPYV